MMNLDALTVSQEKLDNNYLLYYYLKTLNSVLSVPTLVKFQEILGRYAEDSDITMVRTMLQEAANNKRAREKYFALCQLLASLTLPHHLTILAFSLKLIQLRPYLLEKAKLVQSAELFDKHSHHPLSLAADSEGTRQAFYMRVHGALLALLFSQEIEQSNTAILQSISNNFQVQLVHDYHQLQALGVEANQMFMLMFSESMSQSIKSLAGSSFEEKIKQLLQSQGIQDIKKIHDAEDASTEYDFFFQHKGIRYGLGAKRTLRERYKQFIKTARHSHIDVMVEVTLGLDLRENTAQIIRDYGVYLFVADEVYQHYSYLEAIKGVFPASALSLATLEQLT